MYPRNTQPQKSGMSSSQALGNTLMKKKNLLQDNSWIKRDIEEDEPVDDDPNYGRDVLGSLKTQSSAGKFSESQDLSNKNTTSTATKPPVPQKKTTRKPQSSNFTARVFGGANLNDNQLNPVKSSIDEKLRVSYAYSEVPDGPPKSPSKTSYNSQQESTTISTSETTYNTQQESTTLTTLKTTYNPPEESTTISTFRRAYNTPEESTMTSPSKTSYNTQQDSIITSPSKTSYNTQQDSIMTSPSKTSYNTQQDSIMTSPSKTSYNTQQEITTSTWKTYTYNSQQESTPEMTYSPTVKLFSHSSQTPSSPINLTPAPSTPSRIVGKRDLCSFCAKGIVETERIILDDLQIFSHTFCFKCDMCHHALGSLEAGDTLWVYRGRVICEKCYIKTKDQWYR